MKLGVAFLAAAFLAVAASEKVRYDNCQVYSITPKNTQEVQALHDMETILHDFSFWKTTNQPNRSANVMVPPHKRQMFHDIMKSGGLDYELVIPNVQELMDEQEAQLSLRSTKAMDWSNYHDLDEIHDWLRQLAQANPDSVKVANAGRSYEGRDVLALEITNGDNLPGVIIESGIHAREWIAPAATSWVINEILNSPANSIWRQFNYVYVPIANPDGYSFTWESDRAWRKTRVPYKVLGGLLTCYGADPNRNWDFKWMEGGSSSNACDETFAGPSAFSEPEVKSLAKYFTSVSSRNDIYLAFHSYSQLCMYPWGYTGEDTPLEGTWKRIGQAAMADLKAVHGTSFDVGSIFDIIYQASGSSIEWYYGNYNSTLTYAFELRDTGRYGFQLPANQIIPSGEELIEGIKTLLTEYQKLPQKTVKPTM